MDLQSATDTFLMQAIQRKVLGALEELYDRHHGKALAVAFRVLEDRSLAEDVVQEAFLAVWRQAEAFRPERGNVRSWFFSIVRHRAIDLTRGGAFKRERLSIDEVTAERAAPDPWDQVSANIDQEQIKHAVEALSKEQMEVINLAYFGGHTQQEISEMIVAPLGTVKSRVRLAMLRLRNLLKQTVEGETD